MTTLDAILARPETAALGWTLVHFVWQGALVALVLAAALRLLRNHSPQARYVASAAALGVMIVAPLVTLVVLMAQARPVVDGAAPTAIALVTPGAWSFEHAIAPMLPRLTLAWFVGMCLFQVRLAINWSRAQSLRRRSTTEANATWQRRCASLARRLGVRRRVTVLVSACAPTAAVVGWLRPVIVLPAVALTGLSPAQLEAILGHELAHVRRHDYLVNLLQSLAESVLFYHPAVWWVSHQLRVEREYCCDDLVLGVRGDAAGYARALCALEDLRDADVEPALASTGGSLMHRIARLAGTPLPAGRRGNVWLVPAIAAVAFTATALTGAVEKDKDAERPALALMHDGYVEQDATLAVDAAPLHATIDHVDLVAAVRAVDPESAAFVALLKEAGYDNRFVIGLLEELGTSPKVMHAIDAAAGRRDLVQARLEKIHVELREALRAGTITEEQARRKIAAVRKEVEQYYAETEAMRRRQIEHLELIADPALSPEQLIDRQAAEMTTHFEMARKEMAAARKKLVAGLESGEIDAAKADAWRARLQEKARQLDLAQEEMRVRVDRARAVLARLRADGLAEDEIKAKMREVHPLSDRLHRHAAAIDATSPHAAAARELAVLEEQLAVAHERLRRAAASGELTDEQIEQGKVHIEAMKKRLVEAQRRIEQDVAQLHEHLVELKERGMSSEEIRRAIEAHLKARLHRDR